MENHHNNRLYGLDTLRAVAIIIVLIYHYKVVVSSENIFGFMSQLGWTGVDLFFVLSGYLIGNQVLSAIAKGQEFSLKLFYIRRFLRTLPNYYFVLALYFIFPVALSGTATASLWSFLTFTQNLGMRAGETFTHSWSLCIEEQFYLIFPIVTLFTTYIKRSITLGWFAIIGAMLLAIFLRGFNWFEHGEAAISAQSFMEHIYYTSFTRFDELLPGVAIALLKNFHPTTYAAILRRGNLLLVVGLVSVGMIFYVFQNYAYIEGYGRTFHVVTFGYSFLAISFAILVLAALSPNSVLYHIRIPGAASLALWSYAIYLIHKPLFQILKAPVTEYDIDINSGLGIAIIMAVSIFCGWALYFCVETPFMKLRARFFPSNTKTTVIPLSRQQVV
ncbi:acyltransferase family protein [Shewanella salipaludis]|uniref:Acyltransferase n=1 Tax=Shewanella salipaludis TaxID=2723052 RepID=A0A972JKC8_9GAMM|nr:acyltransferase [Shewanella salipaludis]NMH67028.1 acyltransferase [Shewanella salipaludis]